jgi:hypothetical protein
VFFNSNKIPPKLVIEIDGMKYENLFPLNLLQEMVEEYPLLDKGLTDLEIAERIIDYRFNECLIFTGC